MKKIAALIAISVLAGYAIAQSFSAPQWSFPAPIATNISQCQTPVSHSGSFCPVEALVGGVMKVTYYGWDGTGWVPLSGGTAVGAVFTFNGRKPDSAGNVAPAAGDYSYAQIANTPPAPPAAVLTFNGRNPDATGNIAPAAADYNYGQISGTPVNPVLTVNQKPGPNVVLTPVLQ
jgi:hypothetical protein